MTVYLGEHDRPVNAYKPADGRVYGIAAYAYGRHIDETTPDGRRRLQRARTMSAMRELSPGCSSPASASSPERPPALRLAKSAGDVVRPRRRLSESLYGSPLGSPGEDGE